MRDRKDAGSRSGGKRRHLSAIFPRSEAQRQAAARSREREAARRKGRIFKEILPEYAFRPAEAHPRKVALRGKAAPSAACPAGRR
jgi:peptide methionine sulfoxide reductase MsrA